jgi:hypothetical protein
MPAARAGRPAGLIDLEEDEPARLHLVEALERADQDNARITIEIGWLLVSLFPVFVRVSSRS